MYELSQSYKIGIKSFDFFLHDIKMEPKILIFDKHCIAIIIFNRWKELITISKGDIKR